jgi:hypothetical protein
MNRGLDSWLDTCIALHSLRTLSDPKAKADLLRAALAANPYNTDVWFELAALAGTNLNSQAAVLATVDQCLAASGKADAEAEAHELSPNTDFNKVQEKSHKPSTPEREAASLASLLRTLLLRDVCQAAVRKPARHAEVLAFANAEMDRCARAGHAYKDDKLGELLVSLGAPRTQAAAPAKKAPPHKS